MFNQPAGEQRPLRATHLCILVVEDHEDTANLLRRLLSSFGHDVILARSAAEALEHSRSLFDVIIADLNLPDGSGSDVLREFRSVWPVRGIAMTGDVDAGEICRAAGFQVHLTKPISLDRLISAIDLVCSTVPAPQGDPQDYGCPGRHLHD